MIARFGSPTFRYPLGLSRARAELYGKPHVGAAYTSGERYRLTSERCAVCGRFATNSHHVARRSWATEMPLETPKGAWALRSPLMAVCGSGTCGCHGKLHNGGLTIEWEWDEPDYERAWWDGELLLLHDPHSPALYRYGQWAIHDLELNTTKHIRRY